MCPYEFCVTAWKVLQDVKAVSEFNSEERIVTLNIYSCQDHIHIACVQVSIYLRFTVGIRLSCQEVERTYTVSALYCVVWQLHRWLYKEPK